MPTIESVKQRANGLHNRNDSVQLQKIIGALQADVAALRASLVAVTAKLDADATVTDTNYAATCNPAALTTSQ